MLSKKEQLLGAAVEYLAENGLANFSLRPVASQLKTSARMLLFHFESREGLLRAVFSELNSRLQRSFEALVARNAATPTREAPLLLFWDWAVARRNFRYLRLLYELQVIAAQDPAEYSFYMEEASAQWRKAAMNATSAGLRSEALATILIAVFDGLFLELMTTGDRKRLRHALKLFISLVRGSANPRRRGTITSISGWPF